MVWFVVQGVRRVEPTVGNLTSRREFLGAFAAEAVLACGGLLSGCGAALRDKLSVEPRRARGDEAFVVRLRGLSAGERVVLTAAFDDAFGQEWSSTAVFEADGDGSVDTSERSPVEGSYGVEDPMGLVWSALGPNPYTPPLPASPVRLEARVGDERAGTEVERFDLAEWAHSEEVREGGLVGRLFSPDGSDAAPGVLVLGGSEGGLSPFAERQAALLASRGYAALALAYFRGEFFEPEGAEGLPETLKRVPLEYFGRAVRWLRERDGVDGDRIGALGTSRGGELALLLGSIHREIKAVVSYVGSGVVTPAIESGAVADEPAWTRRGEPVPYVWFGDRSPSEISDRELRREAEEAAIPVEQTNGPVLLIAAGGDAVWDSVRLSRLAMDRLEGADRSREDELAVYPEAGHALGAPYVPTGDSTARASAGHPRRTPGRTRTPGGRRPRYWIGRWNRDPGRIWRPVLRSIHPTA